MDAVKFVEERNRMCKSTNPSGCRGCPAFVDPGCCAVGLGSAVDAIDQIAMVEKWSSEHPRKTRQDVLLEMYPTALLMEDGTLSACPVLFLQNAGTRMVDVQDLTSPALNAEKSSGVRK